MEQHFQSNSTTQNLSQRSGDGSQDCRCQNRT
jgi:hypothetical protein